MSQLNVGDIVLVRVFSGAVAERRVVGESEFGPLVATEGEYQAAAKEGREAEGIGWPAEHIIGRKKPDYSPMGAYSP